MVGWLCGWTVGWLDGWWLDGMVGWLDGWMNGWMGWLDGMCLFFSLVFLSVLASVSLLCLCVFLPRLSLHLSSLSLFPSVATNPK